MCIRRHTSVRNKLQRPSPYSSRPLRLPLLMPTMQLMRVLLLPLPLVFVRSLDGPL